jgi:hypothetical protein
LNLATNARSFFIRDYELENQSHYRYGPAFLVCFAMACYRTWPRLMAPEIWAEDGAIFIADWLSLSFKSLLLPFWGSYHTIQRLVGAVIVSGTPILWWPMLFCVMSLAIYALIACTFTRRGYAWLVPSHHARFIVTLLPFYSPGLFEVAGNLANINWMLLVWLGLLGIRDPKEPIKFYEIGISLFITTVSHKFLCRHKHLYYQGLQGF